MMIPYCTVTNQASISLPPGSSHHALHLQLREISLDPGVTGQQVLGGVEDLLSLAAGQQQLVGSLPHPDLKIKLFLDVGALQQTRGRTS